MTADPELTTSVRLRPLPKFRRFASRLTMSSPRSTRSTPSPSSLSDENVVFTPRTTSNASTTPSPITERRPLPDDIEGNVSSHIRNLRLSNSLEPAPAFNLSSLGNAIKQANGPTTFLTPSPSRRPATGSSGAPSTPSRPSQRSRHSSPRASLSKHSVADEPAPEDRFHAPEFQRSFSDARAVMESLARVLGSSAVHVEPDSTIQALRRKAEELARFECPPTRTVGLVGDSGVGKSSLLNSLLDTRDLARTSNNGTACTCVVTEYRYHSAESFRIDVDLFDEAELTIQVTNMLEDYRHFFLHSSEMENDEERKHWKDRADLACDTFQAMFRGRFSAAFLQSQQPQEQLVATLFAWMRDMRPRGLDNPLLSCTLVECSNSLMSLTSEVDSSGPAAWPYIKKITVSLNAHILSKGLVLVDLPGLRDLNAARRNITERYILECDEIFAVCFIGRAITDAGIASVFDLAKKANLSNVGIICTRSDDINPNEAHRDWKGLRAKEIQRLFNAANRAKEDLEGLQEQLDDLRGDSESDSSQDDDGVDVLVPLYRSLEKASDYSTDSACRLQRYLVLTRNALVTTKISELYGRTSQVKVFCASNTLYWDHRDVCPKEKAIPFLELSGIIGVRQHCIGIVSDSQLRIATSYLRDSIPNLLSRLQLWVQSGAAGSANAERKEVIRTALDALEQKLRQDLMGMTSRPNSLARRLTTGFQAKILNECHYEEWTRGAVEAGWEWSSWHHCKNISAANIVVSMTNYSTYAAFCRQYGNHSTAAVGDHDWNTEAMETMADNIAPHYRTFHAAIQAHFDATIRSISQGLERAYEDLGPRLADNTNAIAPLEQALGSRQRILETAIEDIYDKFYSNLATLRTDALSGLRTSYFGQAMESSYRDANRQSGPGSWARKKNIINGKLGEHGLFEGLMRRLRSAFKDLANDSQTEIQAEIAENLEVIKSTLDLIRSENIALESERDPGFRNRVGAELQLATKSMDKIQGVVGRTGGRT
ncbi:hypothetical protein B0T14DRAFT_435213 [Immersiella caudata]|uniref:Uncharacterized protein n=1 Tax=Immersiella caudata TaxID=314043 RepID=A0AA39WLG9_9PEZI|nr:hypothetical protein B0T14DRAFT_435213 [Immersiella caudata]